VLISCLQGISIAKYNQTTLCPCLEDERFTVYEDERKVIANVSIFSLQRQSNKGKPSSNEALRSQILHIEHMNS